MQLLRDAMSMRDMDVNVVALVNDTVGTLMAEAYRSPDTHIGLILGTGTNACYVENMDEV